MLEEYEKLCQLGRTGGGVTPGVSTAEHTWPFTVGASAFHEPAVVCGGGGEQVPKVM